MLKGLASPPRLLASGRVRPQAALAPPQPGWRPAPASVLAVSRGVCEGCSDIRCLLAGGRGPECTPGSAAACGRLLHPKGTPVVLFPPFIQSCVLTEAFSAYVVKVIPDKFRFNSPLLSCAVRPIFFVLFFFYAFFWIGWIYF